MPDFAALYEPDVAKGAAMSSRMAYWLWTTCIYLADTWKDSRDDPGDGDQERLAACTGEELALALHLVIGLAEAQLADGMIGQDHTVDALPDHGSADADFDATRDRLFLDHDVLMLFDPSLDGVDDPDSEIGRAQRAANLHPRDWFKSFALS